MRLTGALRGEENKCNNGAKKKNAAVPPLTTQSKFQSYSLRAVKKKKLLLLTALIPTTASHPQT